jgi:hypothetical protein
LPPALAAQPGFSERFTREARALARLAHPHIVGVFDFGERAGFCYLLMEYVNGVNLRQAMRAGGEAGAGAVARAADLRGAAICARPRGIAPGHQAGEHPARHDGNAQAGRFRHCETRGGTRLGNGPHADGGVARHGGLHGAGADRKARDRGPPRGHLQPRRGLL